MRSKSHYLIYKIEGKFRPFLIMLLLLYIAIFLIGCMDDPDGSNQSLGGSGQKSSVDTDLPTAFVGQRYSAILQVVDARSPTKWKEDSIKKLPLDLTLNPNTGLLSGVPKEAGTFIFIVWVSNNFVNNGWSSILVRLKIESPEIPVTSSQLFMTTTSPLPTATVGMDYSITLAAKNAKGQLNWSSFDLPGNFSLDPQSGLFKGKPNASGRFCFTISITDSSTPLRSDRKTFALTINSLEENEQTSSSDYSPRQVDNILARLECGQILFNPPSKMKLDEVREVKLLISLNSAIKDLKQELFNSTQLEKATRELTEQKVDTRKLDKAVEDLKEVTTSPNKTEDTVIKRKTREVENAVEELQEKGIDTGELKKAMEQVRKITVIGRLDVASVLLTNRMNATLEGPAFKIEPLTSETQAVSARDLTEWKWSVKANRPSRQKLHLTLSAILKLDGSETNRTIKTFEKDIEVEVTSSQNLINFYSDHWKWIWGTILIPIIGGIWTWAWKVRKHKNQNSSSINSNETKTD